MKARDIAAILARIPSLPDSAKIPLPAAAVHEGVSVETIERHYPLIRLTPRIRAVELGHLRRRQTTPAVA
jgi:sulfopyruvate decarboxylase TPP-binding subunit